MIGVFFYIIIKELYFSLISVSKKIKSSDYSFFPILYNYKNSFISYAFFPKNPYDLIQLLTSSLREKSNERESLDL